MEDFRITLAGSCASRLRGEATPIFWEVTYCTLMKDLDLVEKLLWRRLVSVLDVALPGAPPAPGDELLL